MRYYAGNWATSAWLFRKGSGAEEKLDTPHQEAGADIVEQVGDIYDRETALYLLNRGLAFRAMHSHGRALNALLPHAVDDVEDYDVREGELISNVVNGWNFGDAHFHGAQLLEAIQERCGFGAGRRARDLPRVRADDARPRLPALRDLGPGRRAARGGHGRGEGHGHQPALARRVLRLPGGGRGRRGQRAMSRCRSAAPSRPILAESLSEAIVVGSGPNGLACAVELARNGVRGDGARGRRTGSAAARAPAS